MTHLNIIKVLFLNINFFFLFEVKTDYNFCEIIVIQIPIDSIYPWTNLKLR